MRLTNGLLWMEDHLIDGAGMTRQLVQDSTGCGVPNIHKPVNKDEAVDEDDKDESSKTMFPGFISSLLCCCLRSKNETRTELVKVVVGNFLNSVMNKTYLL